MVQGAWGHLFAMVLKLDNMALAVVMAGVITGKSCHTLRYMMKCLELEIYVNTNLEYGLASHVQSQLLASCAGVELGSC